MAATRSAVLDERAQAAIKQPGSLTFDGLVIRSATLEDLDDIVRVCDIAWKGIWHGDREEFADRIRAFPECGIVVGEIHGRIEGYVSVQLANENTILLPTWNEATDSGRFTKSHNPDGEWLHGVGLAVTPLGCNAGLTMRLILYLYEFAVTNNKRGCRFVTRMRGYRRYKEQMTPQDYVLQQRGGKPLDSELRIMVAYGFQVVRPPIIFEDYVEGGGDPGSCGYGVLVEQLNPHFVQP